MRTERLFKDIFNKITDLASKTEQFNRLNLTDSANFLEDFIARLLNIMLDINLENANKDVSNFPGIDLIDKRAEYAVQITSQATGFKKKKDGTQKSFIAEGLHEEFKELRIVFFTNKRVSSANLERTEFISGCFYEGYCLDNLLKLIKQYPPAKMQEILNLLDEEITQNHYSGVDVVYTPENIIKISSQLSSYYERFINDKFFSNYWSTLI